MSLHSCGWRRLKYGGWQQQELPCRTLASYSILAEGVNEQEAAGSSKLLCKLCLQAFQAIAHPVCIVTIITFDASSAASLKEAPRSGALTWLLSVSSPGSLRAASYPQQSEE